MMAAADADHSFQHPAQLQIIGWEHLDVFKFDAMIAMSTLSIRGALYPITVVRSRLQLQKQNTVYRSMRHAFFDMFRKEGFTGFYRGFFMALPQTGASFLYSNVYEKARDYIQSHTNIKSAAFLSSLAGVVASTTSQMLFVPTDIVSQHMMIYNNPSVFLGKHDGQAVMNFLKNDKSRLTLGLKVIRAVYRADGIPGFYRGLFSAIFLYAPSALVFWSSYYYFLDCFKYIRKEVIHPLRNENAYIESEHYRNIFVDQGIAGMLSGAVAAICTNPLDVLRVRIQVQRRSFWETIRRLVHVEGKRVFTKGLQLRIISTSLHAFFVMLCYETVKKHCVLPEYVSEVVW